jgi:hypothetical protein
MHVAHITSHFASLDYMEVIRVRAIRSIFATRLSHRCNRGARSRDDKSRIDGDRCGSISARDVMAVTSIPSHRPDHIGLPLTVI